MSTYYVRPVPETDKDKPRARRILVYRAGLRFTRIDDKPWPATWYKITGPRADAQYKIVKNEVDERNQRLFEAMTEAEWEEALAKYEQAEERKSHAQRVGRALRPRGAERMPAEDQPPILDDTDDDTSEPEDATPVADKPSKTGRARHRK